MTRSGRNHLDRVFSRLERALDGSPADYTELIWIETRSRLATSSNRPPAQDPQPETTVLVRVRERRRFGHHRAGSDDSQYLQDAVRNACGQARFHAPINRWRTPLDEVLPSFSQDDVFDLRLAAMSSEEGREFLQSALEKGERGQLEWTEGQIAIANDRGLRRQARVTSATVFVSAGHGAEAGTARSSARTLQRLDLEGTVRRARGRRSPIDGGATEQWIEDATTVLSPEAVTAVIEELSHHLLEPGLEGQDGFFQRHGGLSVSHPTVDLFDDACDLAGMPFPFDLKGAAKHPLPLIREGVIQPIPRGASVPEDQLGPFSAGGGEVRCSNLVLKQGRASEEKLLAAADQGIWVSSFSHLDCFEPKDLKIRCRARGLRRIRDGRLAEALPDQILETSLADFLGRVREVGDAATSRAFGNGVFGGTTAPALLLEQLAWRGRRQSQ